MEFKLCKKKFRWEMMQILKIFTLKIKRLIMIVITKI